MWERWPHGASERVPCVARGEVVDAQTELEELTNWLLQSSKAGSEIRPAVTSHISNTLQRSPSEPDREKLPLPRLTDTSPEHIQNEDTHITGWLRKTLLCNRYIYWYVIFNEHVILFLFTSVILFKLLHGEMKLKYSPNKYKHHWLQFTVL